jgi:DNA polymerase IV
MRRVIFLVDMNAFFIGCEMTRKPELKGSPAAVAGDPKRRSGIILAANYEARKFGVKTTMVLHEALKLCPGLVLVPPEHRFYEEKSREVMEILSRFSPEVQQNSIDEAWIDLTGCESLFGSPLQIAQKIMKTIMEELDLWCSIGISENKFLAKMASERKKPLGITEIWEKDVPEKIWPLPVREMYGIGKQTEKKLSNMGIMTIGDIAAFDKKSLCSVMGKYGEDLYRLAHGIDPTPVSIHYYHVNKSISRSTTLSRDITDIEYAKSVLLQMAEEVGSDARRQATKGKTISIEIKYDNFESITRQKSVPFTYLTRDIYKTGCILLEENWNSLKPVRLLGIGLANYESTEINQLSIFDMIEAPTVDHREEKLEKAVDTIRERFGSAKIKRAKTL